MDAFLLSAGKGTRLRPLTDTLPKPLIELGGKPLIAWNLECLKNIGCLRVIINTSYLAQQIFDFVGDGSKWGLEVLYSYEEELLDTGGGLKNIFNFITSTHFITWNADVFVDPNFSKAEDGFKKLEAVAMSESRPIVSLLVRSEDQENIAEYGELQIDEQDNLIGFLGKNYLGSPEEVMNVSQVRKVMFAGISIMSTKVRSYFPENKAQFSLTKDMFPEILADNNLRRDNRIKVSTCNYYWNDIGTTERLKSASYKLK